MLIRIVKVRIYTNGPPWNGFLVLKWNEREGDEEDIYYMYILICINEKKKLFLSPNNNFKTQPSLKERR